MIYNNPCIIELPEDVEALLMHSLAADEQGNPVYTASFRLKAHRQYDAEPHTLVLPGMPTVHLHPLYPSVPDTDKRQAVTVEAEPEPFTINEQRAAKELEPIEVLPQGSAFQVDQVVQNVQSPLDPVPDAQGAVVAVNDSPERATGGVIETQQGWAMVGEPGPELMTIPDGATVKPPMDFLSEPDTSPSLFERKKSGKLSTETEFHLPVVTAGEPKTEKGDAG